MTPWRDGDPVGSGEVYLPDTQTRLAYAAACQRERIDSCARHVLSLPTLEQRRAYIQNHKDQTALKSRVTELWNKNE